MTLVHPLARQGLFPVVSFEHFAIANLIVFPDTQLKFYLLDHHFLKGCLFILISPL